MDEPEIIEVEVPEGRNLRFKVFDKAVYMARRYVRSEGPTATVLKSNILSLNRYAWESLGDPRLVMLYYDEQERRIGLRTSDDEIKAHAVRPVGRSTRVVSVRRFLSHFGIDASRSRRYPAEMDGDMLVVDLKKQPLWEGV